MICEYFMIFKEHELICEKISCLAHKKIAFDTENLLLIYHIVDMCEVDWNPLIYLHFIPTNLPNGYTTQTIDEIDTKHRAKLATTMNKLTEN